LEVQETKTAINLQRFLFLAQSKQYQQYHHTDVVDNSNGSNLSSLHCLIAGVLVFIFVAFSCSYRCLCRIFVVVSSDIALLLVQWLIVVD
jgi:hypothetical protein